MLLRNMPMRTIRIPLPPPRCDYAAVPRATTASHGGSRRLYQRWAVPYGAAMATPIGATAYNANFEPYPMAPPWWNSEDDLRGIAPRKVSAGGYAVRRCAGSLTQISQSLSSASM